MKNILLIQTGGTIAMDIGPNDAHELDPGRWTDLIYEQIPELSEIANIQTEKPFFHDSSDVGPPHWDRLITLISENRGEFDGFVILHGTDTMAYTASALSFGLQGVDRPVILTGSQVPMRNIRSDARRNLVNAIEMATLPVNEVAICFNDYLYRGNRSSKMSIGDFDAFASPNRAPLAEIGISIERHPADDLPRGPFSPASGFDDRVFLVTLYPGLTADLLGRLDLSDIRAVVVEAFGSGNFPLKEPGNLLPVFEKWIEGGRHLVITSQAAYDAVDLTKYESGRQAAAIGALSAGDMTTEATLTKMMYLLQHSDSDETVRQQFTRNLAGERTE